MSYNIDPEDIKVLEIGKRDGVTFMKFLKKFSSEEKEVKFCYYQFQSSHGHGNLHGHGHCMQINFKNISPASANSLSH